MSPLDGDNGFDMGEPIDITGTPVADVIVLGLLLCSFVMTYFISRLYYDCQPPEEEIILGEENHALRKSVTTALFYVYSHQLLFFGLLGLGMGIKITASNLQSPNRRKSSLRNLLVVDQYCINILFTVYRSAECSMVNAPWWML